MTMRTPLASAERLATSGLTNEEIVAGLAAVCGEFARRGSNANRLTKANEGAETMVYHGENGSNAGVSSARQWFALRTEPNKERALVNVLIDAPVNIGPIIVYLPICDKPAMLDFHRIELDRAGNEVTLLTGERQQVKSLIVPGYIFANLVMSDAASSWITDRPGVLRILPSSLRPLPIDDGIIQGMRYECSKLIRQTEEVPDLDWMLGKMWRVKEGNWADRIGPCLSFARDGRPQIAIETVKGRYQALPFPLENIAESSDQDAYMAEVARLNQRAMSRHKRERCRAAVA